VVKGKNKKMNLEELFKKTLEQSDPVPGNQVRNELMKKLARREFVRFNPSRLNIYYIAGIVAAGIATTLLLVNGPQKESKTDPYEKANKMIKTETPLIVPVKGSDNGPESEGSKSKEDQVEIIYSQPSEKNTKDVSKAPEQQMKPQEIKIPALIADSVIRKSVNIDNLSDIGNKAALQVKTTASFDVSTESGCIPLKVSFQNNSQAFDSCRWIFGDGGFSDATDPIWIFDRPGEFKVTLTSFGKNGEEASESLVINVYPEPEARFEFQPENPILPDDAIRFVNYSVDAVKYRWDFGDGRSSDAFEPEHKYDRYGNYDVRLIVWSEHGCTDSVIVINALAGSGCYIDFPNAFIPNPDGPSGGYYTQKSDEEAQVFHPVTSGVSEFQLRIFSKIGILIFESNDINIGWDGYHKGQLCESGVYIWKVRGIYKNGEPFVKMGDLTLLKK
jgi:PKD repeat protein